MKLKWEGREAFVHIKPVNKLKEWIPHFRRYKWHLHNGGSNKYLDVIIREALRTDGEYVKDRQNIPVCTAILANVLSLILPFALTNANLA